MKSVLRIFFSAKGTNPYLVLMCFVLSGFAEAIGITTLLPILTEISGGASEHSSPANQKILSLLSGFGISPSLENLILLVVIVLSLKAVISFGALSYVGFSVAKLVTHLRHDLISKLMDARWNYFLSQKVGKISNAASIQAAQAGQAYKTSGKFVSLIIQGLVYGCVALLVSFKLGLLGLAVGLSMAASLNILVKMSKKAGFKEVEQTSNLVTNLSDTLNNIKAIKAMNRQGSYVELFSKNIRRLRNSLRKQIIAEHGRYYGEEVIITICLGVTMYVASVIWEIPLAELVVLGIIFFQGVSIIGKIQKQQQVAVQLERSYWAITELIEDTGQHKEIHSGTKAPSLKKDCRFTGVNFAYKEDGKPVLNNITLTIPAGKITVLRGASGSGKTTILDLLIGLLKPQKGEITIDGTSISDLDLVKWRQKIGYVSQELSLLHDTIRNNITLGDQSFTEKDLERVLVETGLTDLIKSLPEGLETNVGERGGKLSGGQRQRIALARALINKPELLILDEVTSALDPETEKRICANIKKLGGTYTILAITHRPIWSKIANNLYDIANGKARKSGKARKNGKAGKGKK